VGAVVNVSGVESELRGGSVGVAFYFFRPPSAHIVDGGKDFLRGLVYAKGSTVILIIHWNTFHLLAERLFAFGDGFPDIGLALACSDQVE